MEIILIRIVVVQQLATFARGRGAAACHIRQRAQSNALSKGMSDDIECDTGVRLLTYL